MENYIGEGTSSATQLITPKELEPPKSIVSETSKTCIKENSKRQIKCDLNCKNIVRKRLPITEWSPKYNFSTFLQDLLAGFTVALTEVPQGIAYAIVAGLPTQYGLYSGFMGGIVYFFFGTCKDINVGPTAILALLIQSHVAAMGPDAAVLIAFIAGLIIFLAGLLHLGFLVEFFSFPVISGFTTAAALNIATSQLLQLFGIKGKSSGFLEALINFFKKIQETQKWDCTNGLLTVAFLLFAREIKKYGSLQQKPEWSRRRNAIGRAIFTFSLAGNALSVITGTSIAYVAHAYYNATPFILTGEVKQGLPNITWPPFGTTYNGTYFRAWDMMSEYGAVIAFCPLIAILEHVAIVKAFSKGKTIDATQELIALGIANMMSSLVQSMPITGSFTRTAVNNASGVKTTTGGVVTAICVLISLACLTVTFQYIPKSTLAGVIMVAMFYLCDFHAIGVMWRSKRLDLIPFFTTLLCCLFISLEYGIIIGTVTNIIFVLFSSARPKLDIETVMFDDQVVYVVKPKTSLHFTSAEYVRQLILKECRIEHSLVVLDGQQVGNIDSTIAKSFLVLLEELEVRKQSLIFWNFKKPVEEVCLGIRKEIVEYFRRGSLQEIITPKIITETASLDRHMSLTSNDVVYNVE